LGVLYLVATPIGNLGDISQRALAVLRQVSLIAAEDTRTTRKLLSHFGIARPLLSYYEHSRLQRQDQLLAALGEGDVALVSDGGMPTISDPGYDLVRLAIDAGHLVTPIPGANAAIAALAVSGLPTDAFTFAGFLPRRQAQRRRRLRELAWLGHTLVLYESPHRVEQTLADLLAELGDRAVSVSRELTKVHEETWRGTLHQAAERFRGELRGEFTLVVAGRAAETWDEPKVLLALGQMQREGASLTAAARQIAAESGWPRARVYGLGLERLGEATSADVAPSLENDDDP
jgi:16S rRNA (cytidine1402-2'-O)-methyltransferase